MRTIEQQVNTVIQSTCTGFSLFIFIEAVTHREGPYEHHYFRVENDVAPCPS